MDTVIGLPVILILHFFFLIKYILVDLLQVFLIGSPVEAVLSHLFIKFPGKDLGNIKMSLFMTEDISRLVQTPRPGFGKFGVDLVTEPVIFDAIGKSQVRSGGSRRIAVGVGSCFIISPG